MVGQVLCAQSSQCTPTTVVGTILSHLTVGTTEAHCEVSDVTASQIHCKDLNSGNLAAEHKGLRVPSPGPWVLHATGFPWFLLLPWHGSFALVPSPPVCHSSVLGGLLIQLLSPMEWDPHSILNSNNCLSSRSLPR